MLDDLFVKSPEQKVLRLFAMNPQTSFYGRQISQKLGISLGAAHAALLSLEKRGILVSRNVGRTKLFDCEESHPIIRSFRVLNTLLILEPLMASIRGISRLIILFGSYAAGTFGSSSDVDLLIVSEEKERIIRKVDSFKRKSGLDLRPIVKDQVEWMELERTSPEFFNELGRGIALWEKPVGEYGL